MHRPQHLRFDVGMPDGRADSMFGRARYRRSAGQRCVHRDGTDAMRIVGAEIRAAIVARNACSTMAYAAQCRAHDIVELHERLCSHVQLKPRALVMRDFVTTSETSGRNALRRFSEGRRRAAGVPREGR
jgi:hypothetical protein